MPLDTHLQPEQNPRMMVMLPGLGNRVSVFRKRGFFDLVAQYQAHFPRTGLVAADAHIGYYRDRSLVTRLTADVLDSYPNREVLLVGVSMGGFGAVILASQNPDAVQELVLIAPFLGGRKFTERMKRGELNEQPGDGPRKRALLSCWNFLVNSKDTHRITLLVGEGDRFFPVAQVLQDLAPHVRVIHGPGGHNWRTWSVLFQKYLDQRCLPP